MKTLSTTERETSMDLLRIWGSFFVVLTHVAATKWYSTPVTSIEWKIYNFYDTAARCSLLLFFFLSGKLFLGKKEMPTLRQLFSKYILKLVILYFVWGLLYAIDKQGVSVLLSGNVRQIFRSFAFYPMYHLWYLPAQVGIYLLLPLIWGVAKYEDGKYLGYACLMFFLFGILWKTVTIFVSPENQYVALAGHFSYEWLGYSGFFMLGHYLDKKRPFKVKSRYLFAGYLIVALIATKIGEMDSVAAGYPKDLLYDEYALTNFLEAVLLYCAFLNLDLKLSDRKAKAAAIISRCTLFVFLVHPFVINHMEKWFGVSVTSFFPLLSIPVITFVIFAVCSGIAYVALKIPVVNRWLV